MIYTFNKSGGYKKEEKEDPVTESPFPDTISKSWKEIIADANAKRTSGYKEGDIKNLRLTDGGFICYEIAGIEADTLSSGGKAAFTFVAKTIDGKSHWTYSSKTKYTESDYKTYIEGTCVAHMPEQIVKAVKEVQKYALSGDGSDVSYQAKFWAPSAHEMGFELYESQGPVYSLYSDSTKRIRKDATGAQNCWLSSYSSKPIYLSYDGSAGSDLDSSFSFGALPCFCL